jgi:hypothetical protein
MQGRDHHATSNVGREALRPPAHSLTIGVATQPMEIAMPWTEAEGALIQDMASEAIGRDAAMLSALNVLIRYMDEAGLISRAEFIERL